jgi:Ni,Fe-hydrogenase I cytochrome b subunit
MPPQKPQDLGPLDAVAFFCEVAMVVLLVIAGHGFADGWRGWAIGAFLAFVALGIWAQWMAANSVRRLDNPTRLVVQIMLFVTVALYAAAGGLVWPGLAFLVIASGVFIALAREEG